MITNNSFHNTLCCTWPEGIPARSFGEGGAVTVMTFSVHDSSRPPERTLPLIKAALRLWFQHIYAAVDRLSGSNTARAVSVIVIGFHSPNMQVTKCACRAAKANHIFLFFYFLKKVFTSFFVLLSADVVAAVVALRWHGTAEPNPGGRHF